MFGDLDTVFGELDGEETRELCHPHIITTAPCTETDTPLVAHNRRRAASGYFTQSRSRALALPQLIARGIARAPCSGPRAMPCCLTSQPPPSAAGAPHAARVRVRHDAQNALDQHQLSAMMHLVFLEARAAFPSGATSRTVR